MYCPTCGHLNLPGADACEKCQFALAGLDVPTAHDRVERSLMADTVASLNPRPPVTVQAGDSLGKAIWEMCERKVGAVLVTNPSGDLFGILTERDFLIKVAGQSNLDELKVDAFLTSSPESVSPTDTLAFALGKMDAGGYRHLPVVDAGKPVGVISVRDLLRHVTNMCHEG
jgi:signal-transduction protein with cAMP-binding, CBS, and nucleotidyltransferase domain